MHAPKNQPTALNQSAVSLEHSRALVNEYLNSYFEVKINAATQMSEQYGGLWKATQHLFEAGGKRLRPHLLFTIYEAYSNGDQNALSNVTPAAAAQEIIHLAMLIHDDIIDRDDIRYGVKNLSGQYNELYEPYIADMNERRHFANSSAILGGDVLISQAHILLQSCNVAAARIARAHGTLADAIFSVAGGEMIDTESSFRAISESDALRIARQKTASYSFVGPLVMGAQLAGAPEDQQAILREMGESLGIAYQIKDDILGVFGDEAKTGKSVSGDIREGKKTYMVEQFYATATREAIEQFEKAFAHHDATEQDIAVVRSLLNDSGARERSEAIVEEYRKKAVDTIDQLTISETHKNELADIIDLCVQREK